VEKDLDGKTCKDQDQQAAELPWCAQPRAEELRGGVMAAAAPHREWRGSAELCSLKQQQGLREWHGAVLGEGQLGGQGQVLHQRAGWHRTGCTGQWSRPRAVGVHGAFRQRSQT